MVKLFLSLSLSCAACGQGEVYYRTDLGLHVSLDLGLDLTRAETERLFAVLDDTARLAAKEAPRAADLELGPTEALSVIVSIPVQIVAQIIEMPDGLYRGYYSSDGRIALWWGDNCRPPQTYVHEIFHALLGYVTGSSDHNHDREELYYGKDSASVRIGKEVMVKWGCTF